ncbi:hypothetical protein ABLE91_28005 [Aquabacter sp. CN5-332]|uniref:hypothetical protein n=1 Tax=Aquabacter sp. CN5-332 TaxID=3156608 RepID=UPI0032B44D7E
MSSNANVTPIAAAKPKAVSGKTPTAAVRPAAVAANAAQTPSEAVQAAASETSAVSAKPPVQLGSEATPEVITPAVAADLAKALWQSIAPGHLVLAADHSDGELQGWWPAKVVSRVETSVTCLWLGYEGMGPFTKPLEELGVMYPVHAA